MRREKPPTGLGTDKASWSGAPPAAGAPALTQQEAADYVRDISRQLAAISTGAGLDLLAYLLDMVCIEAELVKARTGDRPKG